MNFGDVVRQPWGKVFSHFPPDWLSMQPDPTGQWILTLNEHPHFFPLSFVQQPTHMLEPYESWIARLGTIPSRNNWHDFLNAMIWGTFSAIKKTLNQIQAQEIQQHGVHRTATRDAGTLFDENGAIFLSSSCTWFEALQERNWCELLWNNRERFKQETRLILFGHALLEKLMNPYKAITSHVLCVNVDSIDLLNFDWDTGWKSHLVKKQIDQFVSHHILGLYQKERWTSRIFSPLPVLGIPDWSASQDISFYEDRQVFRLKNSAI